MLDFSNFKGDLDKKSEGRRAALFYLFPRTKIEKKFFFTLSNYYFTLNKYSLGCTLQGINIRIAVNNFKNKNAQLSLFYFLILEYHALYL